MEFDIHQLNDANDDAIVNAMLQNFAESGNAVPIKIQSDLQIELVAKKILLCLTVLPAGKVRISVESGWITLSGEVDYFHQQTAVVLALRNLKGVVGIFNHLQVQSTCSSAVIKAEIETTLQQSVLKDGSKIIVSVNGTDVTLSGEIDSWAERSLVNHSAWGAVGVSHVIDHMTMSY